MGNKKLEDKGVQLLLTWKWTGHSIEELEQPQPSLKFNVNSMTNDLFIDVSLQK